MFPELDERIGHLLDGQDLVSQAGGKGFCRRPRKTCICFPARGL
jgi:hypothetical protein